MKKTFIKNLGNYDNPVFSRLAKVFELIILNFLWVAASLPIITIGSATAAMYYTIAKHIRHERGTLVKSFIASFRENLLPGIALTAILAAIVAFLFVDYYCYPFLGEGSVAGSIYLLLLAALGRLRAPCRSICIPCAVQIPCLRFWLPALLAQFRFEVSSRVAHNGRFYGGLRVLGPRYPAPPVCPSISAGLCFQLFL